MFYLIYRSMWPSRVENEQRHRYSPPMKPNCQLVCWLPPPKRTRSRSWPRGPTGNKWNQIDLDNVEPASRTRTWAATHVVEVDLLLSAGRLPHWGGTQPTRKANYLKIYPVFLQMVFWRVDLDDLDLHYAKPKRRARKRGTVQLARTRDPPRANVFKR